MKKLVLVLLLTSVFLIGCEEEDTLMIEPGGLILEHNASAFIVRIDSMDDIIPQYYNDNTIPKTVFSFTCVETVKGDDACDDTYQLSRHGGTVDGEFIGVKNDQIGYPEYIEIDKNIKEYNLYEEDNYYLVTVILEADEYVTYGYELLDEYDATLSYMNQEGACKEIISNWLHNYQMAEDYYLNKED